MTLPNFLIIGKAKSGTTALHATLSQHPQIFMSRVKEPRFFVRDFFGQYQGPMQLTGIDGIDAYQSLFTDADGYPAVGEASPQYLHIHLAETAAISIRQHIPQARLIAILRQPADFAWSMFYHLTSHNAEIASSLGEALCKEAAGQRVNWHPSLSYRANSQSYPQLAAYYQRFARDQIKVYLYEDWRDRPTAILADIFDFLEVKDLSSRLPIERRNVTFRWRSARLHRFLRRPSLWKTLARPFLSSQWRQRLREELIARNRGPTPLIDPQIRRELTAHLREDILQTQDLIQRDLSHWLSSY